MTAKTSESFTSRAWDYATETGQDVRDVYVRLLTLISMDRPEAIDAAFAEMRATGHLRTVSE